MPVGFDKAGGWNAKDRTGHGGASHGKPSTRLSSTTCDLYVLSGGANALPNAFYLPLLPAEATWSYERQPVGPPAAARPTHVYFRSSFCTEQRMALAALVRTAVRDAGLTFLAEGSCFQGGNATGVSGWTGRCRACEEARVVLAFEKFEEGLEYLSEKPFLALAHGAVPAYVGNGQRLLHDQMGVRRRKLLDRASFASDAAFAAAIAALAADAERIDAMRALPTFVNRSRRQAIRELVPPAMRAYACADPRLAPLRVAAAAGRPLLYGSRVPPKYTHAAPVPSGAQSLAGGANARIWSSIQRSAPAEWLSHALCLPPEATWAPTKHVARADVRFEMAVCPPREGEPGFRANAASGESCGC